MFRRLRNSNAFTLMELLIVLAIIALLAGIVAPNFFRKEEQAKARTTKAQIELLVQALDQFRLDTGRYPSTSEGLQSLRSNPGIEGWDGPYLRKETIPDDGWKRPYIYRSPGQHGDFDILSYGKDGSEGGGDDITSWE